MSANNFISVEPSADNNIWEVWVRDADSGSGHLKKVFKTRIEAIDWAAENDNTEYGLRIRPLKEPKSGGRKDG